MTGRPGLTSQRDGTKNNRPVRQLRYRDVPELSKIIRVFSSPKINMVFSGRELIPVFFYGKNNSGIFLALELIPVFLIDVFFQPENNSSIFSPQK